MSILLFVIGGITLVLGGLTIGFGIPINEFSFGNTLIVAGTTAAVGGLIVIGLGAVVSHLQRLADVVAMRAPLRPNRPPEVAEAARAPAAGRAPFLSRSKAETEAGDMTPAEPALMPAPPVMAVEPEPALAEAPTLPNPDVAPVEVPEEAPQAPATAALAEPAAPVVPHIDGAGEPEQEPEALPAWLSAARTSEPPPPSRPREGANFESVWPASEDRTPARPFSAESETVATAPAAAESAPEVEAPEPPSEHRSVAILKSGVVDGMGYTLYVDGSIEAELPQGTLRFASINDLREHLEKAP